LHKTRLDYKLYIKHRLLVLIDRFFVIFQNLLQSLSWWLICSWIFNQFWPPWLMARSRTVLFSEISSAIQIRCSRLPSPSQTSQFYLLIESIKIKKIINLKLTKVKWDTSQSRVFTCGLATNANTTLLIDRINKIQDNQV